MAKRFQKVNVEISNICNLQCSFCPEVIRPKQIMDLELFSRICSEIAPLTDMICLHLMGEPLVHPKFAELVAQCQSHALPIFLVTNGVLLREDKVQTLLQPGFHQVNISLHSFFDNFGDQDPSSYLERIFAFAEAAQERRPELYINFRLWNLAAPTQVGERNREMLQRIEERFDGPWKSLALSLFNPDALDVRRQKSVRIKNRLYLHLDTEFTWPALDLPVLGTRGTCKGLSSHFGVLVDGTVVPCCLDKEAGIALGNIREQSIHQILGSERAERLRLGFQKRTLVEPLCQRCQYIERFR